MTERDFNETDLDEYFILDPEDNSLFLKDINNDGYYTFEKGVDGAEIFTHKDIKDLLNEPENSAYDIDVIKVKDAYEMIGKDINKHKVICQD